MLFRVTVVLTMSHWCHKYPPYCRWHNAGCFTCMSPIYFSSNCLGKVLSAFSCPHFRHYTFRLRKGNNLLMC